MKYNSAILSCLSSLLVLAACNGGGNDDVNDTATEPDVVSDLALDEDSGGDPDVVEDTAMDALDTAGDPVEEHPDCSGMYPGGPFGFQGSIVWNTTTGVGTWDGAGTLLENLCFYNQDDVWTCVAPWYCSYDVDILIYDFTAVWCPPCNAAASDEADFVEWMAAHGWRVAFMSVVEENASGERPALSDAVYWKSYHGIEGEVLYDPHWRYHTAPFTDTRPTDAPRGWPTFFFVNPHNMLIWDAFSGWNMPGSGVTQEDFYLFILSILEMGAANDPDYVP